MAGPWCGVWAVVKHHLGYFRKVWRLQHGVEGNGVTGEEAGLNAGAGEVEGRGWRVVPLKAVQWG